MKCELPQSYIDDLPDRIIEARRKMLLALIPSGVTGGGSDNWWDGGHVSHEEGGHMYSGNRWHGESTTAWGGVSESGRSITVTFTITTTATMTGEKYPCDICNATT